MVDFAFNSFKSFVYSSLYFISLFAENFVKNWLCAAAEVGDLSIFLKKTSSNGTKSASLYT